MDYSDIDSGGFGAEEDGGFTAQEQKPPVLPDDLPKSLNDRRRVLTDLVPETELYDGWQGEFWLRRYRSCASSVHPLLAVCTLPTFSNDY